MIWFKKIMELVIFLSAFGILIWSGVIAYKNQKGQLTTDAPNLVPIPIVLSLAPDTSVINYENKKYVVKTIQVNDITCLFIIYPDRQVSIQPLK
jgi:hypothetical protein